MDQMGGGKFDYPLLTLSLPTERPEDAAALRRQETHHPQLVAEALIKKTPAAYRHDFGGAPLEFVFDAVTYRGADDRTEVEVSYAIPVWQFGHAGDGQGAQTRLDNQITLRDTASNPVFSTTTQFGPFERPQTPQTRRQNETPLYLLALSLHAPAGDYGAAIELRDAATQRVGVYAKPVSVPDYSGDGLLVSDLKLSTGITPRDDPGPFVRHGLNIAPNPGRLYQRGQPVYVYYEMYNLSQDETGATSYETVYEITPMGMPRRPARRQAEDAQSVLFIFEGEGSNADDMEYTSLSTDELESGEYVLTLTLTDRHSGRQATRSANFMVATGAE